MNSTSERAFFDTNVLIYMHDQRWPEKRRLAAEFFRGHIEARSTWLSTQVSQEFFVAVTQKLASCPVEEARGSSIVRTSPTAGAMAACGQSIPSSCSR